MYKKKDLLGDLPKIWRILLCIIPIQLIGSVIGVAIGFHYDNFYNFWVGGVVATPIGFILGVIWHVRVQDESKAYRTVIFFGIIVTFLGGILVFSEIPRYIQEMRSLETFQNMASKDIDQIVIYDEHGRNVIKKIVDPKTLNEFKSACDVSRGFNQMPLHFTSSWYVQIFSDEIIELECHYEKERPSWLIGHFVKKSGLSTSRIGGFYNTKLRGWFKNYVENR
jgi:hypothetical protein